MRHGWFALALLAGGCFDFVGDHGVIGFETNLVVDGRPWQKDAAVANGTEAWFRASERVDQSDAPPLDVTGHATGLIELRSAADAITVTGIDQRGAVSFTGNASDEFDVRFAAPAEVRWTGFFGEEPGDVQIEAGATVPLVIALRDRRGRPLAYAADDDRPDLQVEAIGDGAAWTEEGVVWVQAGEVGPLELRASHHGRDLPTDEVTVVSPDDVVGVELVPIGSTDKTCGVRAVGRTADGREVLGAARAVVDGQVQSPEVPSVATWGCDEPAPHVVAERL